jgi:hypothetical protein
MEKKIKQLQEEAREEFKKIGFYELEEIDKDMEINQEIIKVRNRTQNFLDTLIEQTYNKARKDLIKEDIKRLKKKKIKIIKTPIKDYSINQSYNQALEEEINYKKNNK